MKHPALVPLFGQGLALDFMFTESRIMVAVLLDLMRQGITALPQHDGMQVPASREEVAREAMRKASLEVTGREMPVTKKQ